MGSENLGHAQVAQNHAAAGLQEDVAGLDIAVKNSSLVKVRQAAQKLSDHAPKKVFRKTAARRASAMSCKEFGQSAAIT
jgi:hypothetical protein